ncbi:hypothetical protein VE02_10016 [Pseudogymnoascus sp. 03VT05]|nr:hypothetical protein VE02_10016 [Pseudogymnoascus sp. 03VT05]
MDAKTDLKPIELEELENSPVDSVPAQEGWLPLDDSPCNPRNWPEWKKNAQIVLASMHCMVAAFQAAGVIPSYNTLSKVYDCSLPNASYFVSTQILMLGVSPPFWHALTVKYGRYHVQLLSVICSMLFNIAGAKSSTYQAQLATRILTAFFASPPLGNGSGIVADLCAVEHRGQKMGFWVLSTVLGTPAGPLIMGFVIQHLAWQWMFWIFAMMNAVLVVGYLVIGVETRYRPSDSTTPVRAVPDRRSPMRFLASMVPRSIRESPFRAIDIVSPLSLARYPRIMIPAFASAVTFCYGHIALMAEMPIWMGQKFHMDAQDIGLQFLSVIVGAILGEIVAGLVSDRFMGMMRKRRGRMHPSDRLWLAYICYITMFPGMLMWGFLLQKATSWNVGPDVGIAIANFGNQIQLTILITFSVDCHRDKADAIGVFYNFVRLVYGFLGPFYMPLMFNALGLARSAGVFCGIMAGLALVPLVFLHYIYR